MEQDKFWDFQQIELPESFLGSRARLAWLARLLMKEEKVLNIGVGGGIFEEVALKRGIEVYSVDPSEKTIILIRDKLGLGDRAQVGRGEKLPFPDRKFNAVVVAEVLEHLSDEALEGTLREIYRVLVPGGRIIGTVPNEEDLASQYIFCPHCNQRFHRWGHVRAFDSLLMRDTLGRYFDVDTAKVRLFVSWKMLNWKGKISAFIKLVLFSIGVHGRDENLVFIAFKR